MLSLLHSVLNIGAEGGVAMSTIEGSGSQHGARAIQFLRHLGEMTAAMMIGMFAFGMTAGVLTAANGSTFEEARLSQPELMASLMAISMTIPMIAWMRHRGHDWRSGAEMSVAMVVPAIALIASYWAGGISASSVCPLACALMIPSMAVAMLFRFDEYTGHTHV
jgi:uncharacterized membrane protein YhaH (DUF805 family)